MPELPARADLVIVGAGPAGLTTVLALAHARPRLAERTVVLERAAFPRDKICAGGIGRRADALLASIGVEIDVPSVPIHGISLRVAEGEVAARCAEPIGRVVRRLELDAAFAAEARRRGVRLLEQVRVTEVAADREGVRVETTAGTVRATAVVGADGVGSVVRRTAGLGEAGLRARVVEIDTPGCGADGPRDMLHFEASDRALTGYSWDFPTLVEGRALMCRGAYVLPMGRGARDPREALEAHLRARGLSLEGVRQKRFAERAWAGPAKLSAPRRLLVGEAAGVDPITGEGIPQAIASGILAGRYLGECFERGELGFGDWTARVRRAGFARDLAVRLALVPRFFGAERPWIERFLVGRPWFLRSGIEYFAGRRVPRMVLARAALWGLGLWVRYRLGLG